ncbi:hypothetical protein [Rhodospirillum rubrum]|nr:hypothetical protein [Rhodospirillum rubrum]AEO48626.1 hypothetical protein F11_10810 [Rhodospirillum rubrum F11]QXG78889.1 hypothetical protein KUL73_10870 [Rhodospirillum rubrum]
MIELFSVVFLVALIIRFLESRFERRQKRLDKAFRRARYFSISGISR